MLRDIRRVKVPTLETRCAEGAFGLRDQVLDLLRQQPADVNAENRNVPRHDGHALAARKREQGAGLRDAKLARVVRDAQYALYTLSQHVAPERLQALVELD